MSKFIGNHHRVKRRVFLAKKRHPLLIIGGLTFSYDPAVTTQWAIPEPTGGWTAWGTSTYTMTYPMNYTYITTTTNTTGR